jgi:hypothetical protein
MEDGKHGGGAGFINEAGDKIPQGDAIDGELDLIRDVNFEQGDGVAVWQLNGPIWSVPVTSSQLVMMGCGV